MALKAGRVGVKPSEVTKGGKIKSGGGSPYVLPVATATTLGGVKPVTKTAAMTKEVGVDSEGKLYVEPSDGDVPPLLSSATIENGALSSTGMLVTAQPEILDGEMSATSSKGLTFTVTNDNLKVIELEFDYTYDGSDTTIVFSFGGSNTNGGAMGIGNTGFYFYANDLKFNELFIHSIIIDTKCKIKLVLDAKTHTAKIYINDILEATGTSEYIDNAVSYIISKNAVGLLYNQSLHSQYNSSKVNNLKINIISGESGEDQEIVSEPAM